MTQDKKNQWGQSILEILVAIGLMSLLLPAILTGFVASREGKPQESNRLLASGLVRETEEAIRSIKETSWDDVSVNILMDTAYYPEESGGAWILTAGTEAVGNFTRQVVFSDVQRDGSTGEIVESGGVLDQSTKRAVTTLSWTIPIPTTIESTTYLTRYTSNAAWEQTPR